MSKATGLIWNCVEHMGHGIGDLKQCEDNYITADCKHEVYEGKYIFETGYGKTLCEDCVEDCVEDLINNMSIISKAALMGYDFRTVDFNGKV